MPNNPTSTDLCILKVVVCCLLWLLLLLWQGEADFELLLSQVIEDIDNLLGPLPANKDGASCWYQGCVPQSTLLSNENHN